MRAGAGKIAALLRPSARATPAVVRLLEHPATCALVQDGSRVCAEEVVTIRPTISTRFVEACGRVDAGA